MAHKIPLKANSPGSLCSGPHGALWEHNYKTIDGCVLPLAVALSL